VDDLEDRLAAVLERSRRLGFLGPGDVRRHVDHASAFVAAWPDPPDHLLDLGSGGGVPGLVLAVRWSTTIVVLLDAQARRTAFLADAVGALGLDGRVPVLTGRAEDVARDPAHRGRYDAVTARSFGPPAVTGECAVGFLRTGGRLVVAEPPGAPEARWPAAGLSELGLLDRGVVSAGGGTVRILERTASEADDRWPRRTGVPQRRPVF